MVAISPVRCRFTRIPVLLLSNLERHGKIQRQLAIVNPVQTWRRAKLLVQKIHQAAIDEQLLPDQRYQIR